MSDIFASLADQDLFSALDQKSIFEGLVKQHFETAPLMISAVMACDHNVRSDRIEYAFNEYQQSIARFARYLSSEDPDHYKRAGALLYALVTSEIMTGVSLESSSEELKAGFTRVNLGDAQHIVQFVEFYEQYHNELLAFELAYRCCAAYEDEPRETDFDYLHNVCRYMKSEIRNLTVDTCFMLLKSLMK